MPIGVGKSVEATEMERHNNKHNNNNNYSQAIDVKSQSEEAESVSRHVTFVKARLWISSMLWIIVPQLT